MLYPVNEMFATIQGEGAHTGTPVVLIRLQGCNMRCPWCDTQYTWPMRAPREALSLESATADRKCYCQAAANFIAARARALAPHVGWALVTGGEPSLYDLEELGRTLHAIGFWTMLETNGTVYGHKWALFDWVCVSPKLQERGPLVLPKVVNSADELKFVITGEDDIPRMQHFLSVVLDPESEPPLVSVQPVSQDPEATRICIKAAVEKGWNLSIQLHKLLNLK